VDGCYYAGHCDLGHTLSTSDKAFDYAMTNRGDLPLGLRVRGVKAK
jgi:hypothetical protein